ncbi:PHP domain-containing protein [Mesorhizobium japonicum]|uniref:PHP domain-containing protein n=1 Tax=Mesorhizobium japonicum TaxID=2066070 RepID=UPI003B5AF475
MPAIDLHAHTSASDGTEAPAQLVAAAVEAGLDVVAITDHDTTSGWSEAFDAARGTGVTVLPGLELSTQLDYASVHVLGYLGDPAHPAFIAETERIRAERLHRAQGMVDRIAVDYPLLTWERVLEHTTPDATVGRPHIADALVALGYVPDRTAAFQSILHWRGGYYRPHRAPEPVDGVRLIVAAGGVPVIAHPGAAGASRVLADDVLRRLVDAGLGGLELAHRDNRPEAVERLTAIADRYDLIRTGSSDYHGVGKPNRLGEHTTSPEEYARIVERGTGASPFHG